MRIGTSLFLIALGAILRFAVRVTASGVSIHTIGLILIIVGIVGLALSLMWLAVANRRRDEYVHRDRYVERDRYVDPDADTERGVPVRRTRERVRQR